MKTLTLCKEVSRHLHFFSSSFTSTFSVISVSLSRTIFTPSTATGSPSFTAWFLSSQTGYRKWIRSNLECIHWRLIHLICAVKQKGIFKKANKRKLRRKNRHKNQKVKKNNTLKELYYLSFCKARTLKCFVMLWQSQNSRWITDFSLNNATMRFTHLLTQQWTCNTTQVSFRFVLLMFFILRVKNVGEIWILQKVRGKYITWTN